jgi:hypothetical protein
MKVGKTTTDDIQHRKFLLFAPPELSRFSVTARAKQENGACVSSRTIETLDVQVAAGPQQPPSRFDHPSTLPQTQIFRRMLLVRAAI